MCSKLGYEVREESENEDAMTKKTVIQQAIAAGFEALGLGQENR